MENNSFIPNDGVLWEGILKGVKKSQNKFQPIFEAFTNSLESIHLNTDKSDNGKITLRLHFTSDLFSDTNTFNSITIIDSGIGFDDENLERVNRYKDTRKGFNNRGAGRIQFLHYFDEIQYDSTFYNENRFKQRIFWLSKSQRFLDKKSIIFHEKTCDVSSQHPITILKLKTLLDDKDYSAYNSLSVEKLKDILLTRYMMYFCTHRNSLPGIMIEQYVNEELKESISIEQIDVPIFDKEANISIKFSMISSDMKRIEYTSKESQFNIKAYKIEFSRLSKNDIKLTSKQEVIEQAKVKIENLHPDDHIDGFRYLFLVSSDYLDELDEDIRGEIIIPDRTEYKKKAKELGFSNEEILFDDIEECTNDCIATMYSEIQKKVDNKKSEVAKLSKMFLLNEETISSLRIGLIDSEEKILERVYSAEIKILASQDAEMKKQVESIDDLVPGQPDYQDKLSAFVDDLVKNIPLQKRTALTQYVARRKLVLDVFVKILDNYNQNPDKAIHEKILHNLLFQQSSNNPDNSDLWIINEDFIYFKGCSDQRLCDIKIDGINIFKNEFSQREEEYLHSLGEARETKKPDVLLFPDEGKCIIIEFKRLSENVAVHLNQINNYATLIRNFTVDQFKFDTFYGFLIGESIEPRDVRSFDGDFKHSYQFDYLFRPSKIIVGEDNNTDGSLYTEVIKYSTLLKRAIRRNEVFINKLVHKNNPCAF